GAHQEGPTRAGSTSAPWLPATRPGHPRVHDAHAAHHRRRANPFRCTPVNARARHSPSAGARRRGAGRDGPAAPRAPVRSAGGTVVGMVEERELDLIETRRDGDPLEVQVEEAMTQDVLEVDPAASVARVARTMAERKLGSAVVTHGGEIVGIFSTIDALYALAAMANGTPGSSTE